MLEKLNPLVPSDELKRRYSICTPCDKVVLSMLGAKCGECGCVLKGKLPLKVSTCPLNKW